LQLCSEHTRGGGWQTGGSTCGTSHAQHDAPICLARARSFAQQTPRHSALPLPQACHLWVETHANTQGFRHDRRAAAGRGRKDATSMRMARVGGTYRRPFLAFRTAWEKYWRPKVNTNYFLQLDCSSLFITYWSSHVTQYKKREIEGCRGG
jgi:hypothetical protein